MFLLLYLNLSPIKYNKQMISLRLILTSSSWCNSYQMRYLRHCSSPPLFALSYSSTNKQKKSIFLSGFRILEVHELLALKKNRRTANFGRVTAVDDDSEFEFDPDKAREALRKLDEQLQSLSKKQVEPPKIRAVDLKRAKPPAVEEETPEITGSFLVSLATLLFVFTILYNVIFITVIKPSIDGEEPVFMTSNIGGGGGGASQQFSTRPEVPVGP